MLPSDVGLHLGNEVAGDVDDQMGGPAVVLDRERYPAARLDGQRYPRAGWDLSLNQHRGRGLGLFGRRR